MGEGRMRIVCLAEREHPYIAACTAPDRPRGRIPAQNNPNGGATFTFTLPRSTFQEES
jgi:hypothetical protein